VAVGSVQVVPSLPYKEGRNKSEVVFLLRDSDVGGNPFDRSDKTARVSAESVMIQAHQLGDMMERFAKTHKNKRTVAQLEAWKQREGVTVSDRKRKSQYDQLMEAQKIALAQALGESLEALA
jgi:hypothetical protein